MEHLRRYKTILIALLSIALIVLAALTAGHASRPNFLDQSIGAALIPAQRGLTNLTGWFFSLPQYLRDTAWLTEENRALSEQVAQLMEDSIRLALLEGEISRLEGLLAIRSRYEQHPMIGAQVVAAVSNNWFDSFTIDRGTNHGIARDMPVVTAGGLVGRVIVAGHNYSRVVSYLNIDEASAVSVRAVRTGEYGIVRGDITLLPEGMARMDYIEIGAQLAVGDELVTSNLGAIYPPGLSVGTVSEINTSWNSLFQYALVTPSVDFSEITSVLVITSTFGGHLLDEGLME